MNSVHRKINYTNRFIDLITIFLSWMFAFVLRFIFEFGVVNEEVSMLRYVGYGFLLVLVSAIVFKNLNIYDHNKLDGGPRQMVRVIKGNFFAFFMFLTLSFFLSQDRLSRLMLLYYFCISTILLILIKIYFRSLILKLPIKLVLVGRGESIKRYYNFIKDRANYKILNWYDAPVEYKSELSFDTFNPELIAKAGCDSVLIGFSTQEANLANEYMKKITNHLIPVKILPDVEYAKLGYSIEDFRGIPVLSLNEPSAKPVGLILKRIFDILSCGCGLLLISPLLILIALIIKITSRGPIFYGQIRMGVDGKEFKMWKFRSMIVGDSNKEGWTIKNDPRVTAIGKFLRKTSLDELPQLWNVIIGDMSLVGPRPERPIFVEQFRREIPDYMLRHKFKAGITGWAQVNGWRGDTSIEKRIECDIWYIKNWSLSLDISIIFLTFWKGFINKNAY